MDAAGDQLLAGARFADDQHVDVRVGHLLDRLEHLAHGRAAADDVVEAVGPLDLPAEQFVLGPDAAVRPTVAVRWRPDRSRSRPRPGNRRPPAADRAVARLERGLRIDQNDRQTAVQRASLFQQFQPIGTARRDRRHQQVERLLAEPPDGCLRVALENQLQRARSGQGPSVEIVAGRLAIDDQHSSIVHTFFNSTAEDARRHAANVDRRRQTYSRSAQALASLAGGRCVNWFDRQIGLWYCAKQSVWSAVRFLFWFRQKRYVLSSCCRCRVCFDPFNAVWLQQPARAGQTAGDQSHRGGAKGYGRIRHQ